ncbi:uncharacterized protein LOC132169156 [Corylus avellana]|uniref:uncharacterized protein LOC132169156 n=1 Tax=Corylus avellana TaxID=13451 RepID=UPI001E2398EF|nr:uncharacterized protein LOC132169156 [Corylus avellana]
MGNYVSCCFPQSLGAQTAKLFDAHGNLQQIKLPVKAAELMLEQPGHAVAPVEELRQTRRISAMKADDELSAGKVYLLVPTGKVHCKVSELEMAIIELTCKKRASMLKPSGSKVSPATSAAEPTEAGEDDVKAFGGDQAAGLPGHQFWNNKRWSPVLEPISEAL